MNGHGHPREAGVLVSGHLVAVSNRRKEVGMAAHSDVGEVLGSLRERYANIEMWLAQVPTLEDELRRLEGAIQALEALDGLPAQELPATAPQGPKRAAAREPAAKPPTAPKKAPRRKGRRGRAGMLTKDQYVSKEAVRDWAREQGKFTKDDLANHFDRTESWADLAVRPLVQKSVLRKLPKAKANEKQVFEYLDPRQAATRPRPRSIPLTEASLGLATTASKDRGKAVPGTGNRRLSSHKEIRPMLRAARSQGYEVSQTSGHIRVRNPKTGEVRQVSSSPSDGNAPKKVRRELMEMGVVLG